MTTFLESILQQPDALRALAGRYHATPFPPGLLEPGTLMLTGMGASFHAAAITAAGLREQGRLVHCLESTELLLMPSDALKAIDTLVFVSQSGNSAEIAPLSARLGVNTLLTGVTNDEQSLLAQRANIVLPLMAGEELWVATKTYVNALMVLWLLARQWGGAADGSELDAPGWLADRIDGALARRAQDVDLWMRTLGDARRLIFLGHGACALTARQSAMMCNEWPKQPAVAFSAGAFRHGPIEALEPGDGVVLFAAPGPAHAASLGLAAELKRHGARVLVVQQGRSSAPDDVRAAEPLEANLAAALDVIPAQLFAEALARARGVPAGFRYISKVVSQL